MLTNAGIVAGIGFMRFTQPKIKGLSTDKPFVRSVFYALLSGLDDIIHRSINFSLTDITDRLGWHLIKAFGGVDL